MGRDLNGLGESWLPNFSFEQHECVWLFGWLNKAVKICIFWTYHKIDGCNGHVTFIYNFVYILIDNLGSRLKYLQWTLRLWLASHRKNLGYGQNYSFNLWPKSWVTTWMVAACAVENKDSWYQKIIHKQWSAPRCTFVDVIWVSTYVIATITVIIMPPKS